MILESGRKAKHEYCQIIDGLIQAIVTAKKYKENRKKNPLTEWVSVSDETFLLLCLDNYAHVWRYEVRKKEGRLEEGEKKPRAQFTGKGKGTKKSWDDRAMEVFNKTMRRVWTDRHERGKQFDERFLRYMEFVNPTPTKGDLHRGDEAGAQRPEASMSSPLILSDFNIETVMAQEYKEQKKPKKGNREEIMAGNLCDDDDNDDDEIEYSDNDDDDDNENNDENNDEMSSGSVHEV